MLSDKYIQFFDCSSSIIKTWSRVN